jgi:hypothetical protein
MCQSEKNLASSNKYGSIKPFFVEQFWPFPKSLKEELAFARNNFRIFYFVWAHRVFEYI